MARPSQLSAEAPPEWVTVAEAANRLSMSVSWFQTFLPDTTLCALLPRGRVRKPKGNTEIGRALAGLLLVFGAIVITTGSDPLAVAALAALSLTVFVAWASLNRMPRPAPSLRAGFPGPTPRLCAEGPRPVDHDCPVTLSVIRR